MVWKVCLGEVVYDDKPIRWNVVFVSEDVENCYNHAQSMGYWGCKLRDFQTDTNSCSCLIGDDFLLKIERHQSE